MSFVRMIAGLGNPGTGYANTRHNAGFRAVERLADDYGVSWKSWGGIAETAQVHQDGGLLLVKPQQFMNNSGPVLRRLADFYAIAPSDILVIVDDFSLPLGSLRLRRSGSAGGHNGLASIIEHLGTGEFARLRLGIGPLSEYIDPTDFVLGRFSAEETPPVEEMTVRAADVVRELLRSGWDRASELASRSGCRSPEKEQ